MLSLKRDRVNTPDSRLGQISTEFISQLDHGQGCKYSLFELRVAGVEWMRAEWPKIAELA